MLVFEPLVDAYNSYLPEFKAFYEESFPTHERRSWEALQRLMVEPNMYILLLSSNDRFIGFAIYWKLSDWLFIEHLAIVPYYQGNRYGSLLVKHIMELSNNKLILELELPKNVDGYRRIQFYERLGFMKVEYPYLQPPYRKNHDFIPMMLMCTTTLHENEFIPKYSLETIFTLLQC